MKISLFSLVTILFVAGSAPAVINTDNDILGFYFDTAAETNCLETAPYVTVPMHLVLTNPAMDSIYGYEFGYSASGSYLISGTSLMGGSPLDVGGSQGNHIVGLGVPLTPSGATVLATMSVFVMDSKQIRFDLHGSSPASLPDNSELPALLLSDGTIQSTALSTPYGLPNARINGICNPIVEEASWDGVKSLYH